jgi:hypothetical protein
MFHWISNRLLVSIPLLWAAAGCQAVHPAPAQALPLGSTYLIHLPGIAGDTPFDRWWMDALDEGGAADRSRLYDWTCNDPGIDALQAQDRNRGQAKIVAGLIASRLRADPAAKIVLTAESGGTGIAVWALEALPKDLMVDNVLLIAPALSPKYNLTLALRHVRRKAYYFSSPGDWFILGIGTQLFGTMDGKNTQGAGYTGFEKPANADPGQYKKLVEMKYDPAWIRWGDWGNHTGGMSIAFARHFLAPLLARESRADQAVPATRLSVATVAWPHRNSQ